MAATYLMFVGTLNREAPYFQGARGKGLMVFGFREDTLAVEAIATCETIGNPTFLSVDANRRTIYANSEIFGWPEGLVTALSFDPRTRTISPINMQPSRGSITAHNTISRDGTRLLVVNYGMGEGGCPRHAAALGNAPSPKPQALRLDHFFDRTSRQWAAS